MKRKKLEELNLLDDFLFTTLLSHPKLGTAFISSVLKIILKKDIKALKITPQKTYPGIDTDKHGSRLDVYVEELSDEPGSLETSEIYDAEPDNNDGKEDIAALPRRTRFYHALIDVRSLESGTSYSCLKKVTVIVISSYDPFGRDRMVYTIRNGCVEEPDMPYDDGARTIHLYVNGKNGNPPKELKELLHYMSDTRPANAVNDALKDIQKMVDAVKEDKGVSLSYMKIFEQEAKLRREVTAEVTEKVTEEVTERVTAEVTEKVTEEITAKVTEEVTERVTEEVAKKERVNTDREKKRADLAEANLALVSSLLKEKSKHPDWTPAQLAEACGSTEEIVRTFLAS